MSRWPVCLLVLSLPLLAQEAAPIPTQVPPPAPAAAPTKVVEPSLPATPGPKPTTSQPLLDKGLLDPTWFGVDGAQLKPTQLSLFYSMDFFWAKEGLNLKGRSLRVTWEAPAWLRPETDSLNLKAGGEHTAHFHGYLVDALSRTLGETVKVSATEGDLRLVGRLVECNAKGSYLSYAIESVTYDLKLVDEKTGEVLLACHNRLLGGGGKEGNGSRRRFRDWTEVFATYAKDTFLK